MEAPGLDREAHLITTALVAAQHEDGDTVNEALHTLGEEFGWRGMLHAILSWLRFCQRKLGLDIAVNCFGGVVGMVGINPATGEPVDLDEALQQNSGSAATVTAWRMFSTTANGDLNMAADLFKQAVEDDYGMQVVCAVLALTLETLEDDDPPSPFQGFSLN